MKIRIKVPIHIREERHIEEILLWGIDTEIECEFYTWHVNRVHWKITEKWAVWKIDPKDQVMFALMWGGYDHKKKKRGETNETHN